MISTLRILKKKTSVYGTTEFELNMILLNLKVQSDQC